MEYRDGVNPEELDRDLAPDARDRLAREAGRYLAELHDLGPLEGFGRMTVEDDQLAVLDPEDSWQEMVRSMAETPLSDLADRFADVESDLRTGLETQIGNLPDEVPAVPAHNDYRLGNLLVDPETVETRAVLDWGAMLAVYDEYELANVEQSFCAPAPPDADERVRVRSNLLAGYRERRSLDRDGLADRRKTYLLVYLLAAMRWFPYWYGDLSEAEREELAEQYRAEARALLD